MAHVTHDNLAEPPNLHGIWGAIMGYLYELFAAGPTAEGSLMAGRAEEGIGNPTTVSLQASILAEELLDQLR